MFPVFYYRLFGEYMKRNYFYFKKHYEKCILCFLFNVNKRILFSCLHYEPLKCNEPTKISHNLQTFLQFLQIWYQAIRKLTAT